MKTECPYCGQHYDVDKEYIDQAVECVTCGQSFIVKTKAETGTVQAQVSEGKVNALVCEMCGSTNMVKQNGLFVCQSCGIKYSMEEARKMMMKGTLKVASPVKEDMSEKLKKLYTLARRAKEEENIENAEKYYDMILQEDPESWEASFYQVYYKAMGGKIIEIDSATASVKNCLKNTVTLIAEHVPGKKEREAAFREITYKTIKIASMFAEAATNNCPEKILSSAQICYKLGDLLDSLNESNELSLTLWKKAIKIHVFAAECSVNDNRERTNAFLNTYASKIRRTEPNYQLPNISSSGCYIATAVYGSYDCPEVWTLRRFRDFSLGNNWYGRLFIKLYYAVSPKLVEHFGGTKLFQRFWKKHLDKLVKKLNSQGVSDEPYHDRIW